MKKQIRGNFSRLSMVVQQVLLAALFSLLIGQQAARAAGEYTWPAYSPTVAYDYHDEFGNLEPPTKVLPGVTGVGGVYTSEWWCFVRGTNTYPLVTEAAWDPMLERFETDFAYISDVMGWPRDKRAQRGYYSTIYLLGSGLSTDSMTWDDAGGWMGTTEYGGEVWPCVIATHIPVESYDPAYYNEYQAGAMVHEGIHSILANMPGCFNSPWFHEGGNTWLQGTMMAQRSGDFSGIGWLSAGAAIAPFMPIECYTGWLLDGSFGGPGAQGVYQGDGICTWRGLLGGTQYGECFPHAMEIILGAKSIAWIWRNCDDSGRVLQDMAEDPNGLGETQTRRLIQEYRARQAFCDFGQWSYAFQQLLNNNWGVSLEEEWTPSWYDVDPWIATCYAATTNSGGVLTPEARTLPGWSGANQIPLTVDPAATNATVSFNPIGANMSCQLVYRDTSGEVHYGEPVSSGACSIPLGDIMNNVIVAVVCNTDYIYVDDSTRQAKFDYTLTIGSGITGQADIHTKWYNYNPASYTITASAGADGTITPSGAVSVTAGAAQAFTFAPDSGYEVDEVLLNGFPVGSLTDYTFDPVRGDHTIAVTFRLIEPPATPTGLTATAGNGSVTLDWDANTEDDLAGYTVYRSLTSGSNYVAIASGLVRSDYTDNAVTNGTIYYYKVTASDESALESGFSNEVSVDPADVPPIVEFWDFEDGSNGQMFDADGGANEGSYGVNGTLMCGYDSYWGPTFTSDTSPNGDSLGMDCDAGHQAGEVNVGSLGVLEGWTAPNWTLEVHARFDSMDGWETIVGRNGSSWGNAESDFYLQVRGDNHALRINYRDVDGTQHALDSTQTIVTGQWYGFAIAADTAAGTITMYIDTGSGYTQEAQLTGLSEDLGITSSGLQWTFGRGWYNGGDGDRTDATYDNIRISGIARTLEDLIPLSPASPPIDPEEYIIDGYAATDGTNLSLTVSDSVLGHWYYLLVTDTLTPPDWTTNTVEAGTGSNILFDIPIDTVSTNRFFKLEVGRQ